MRAAALAAWFAALPAPLRRLLPALLAVVLAAELFAYEGLGATTRRIAADTEALAARLRSEDAALRQGLHAAPAPGSPQGALLKQVEALAARTGMRITRLMPHAHDPRLLDVALVAGFADFLRFVSGAELLHAQLQDLQISQPDSAGAGASPLVISFSLQLPASMRPDRAASAPPAVASPALHDPFATGANEADLSEQRHLTGITRLDDGSMATIDGRDYREGDRLGDMTVTAIGKNVVRLSAGVHRYSLHFPTRG